MRKILICFLVIVSIQTMAEDLQRPPLILSEMTMNCPDTTTLNSIVSWITGAIGEPHVYQVYPIMIDSSDPSVYGDPKWINVHICWHVLRLRVCLMCDISIGCASITISKIHESKDCPPSICEYPCDDPRCFHFTLSDDVDKID